MANQINIIDHIETGLKAASLRQATIANNIANLSTPGFRRSEVVFEEILTEAMESGKPVGLEELRAAIVQPGTTPVNANGNDVDLDVEVGELIKNTTMYKTYLRLLARKYRQMELAIRGE